MGPGGQGLVFAARIYSVLFIGFRTQAVEQWKVDSGQRQSDQFQECHLFTKPKCRNWAAKLTELMPRFPLVDRTSEKLVEASVRGCRTAAFGVSSHPSFWTCAAPGGARFDQGWRHR